MDKPIQATFSVDASRLKNIREQLCVIQNAINNGDVIMKVKSYSDLLQEIIDQIDIHRPLGPDGKHGSYRHTISCGCKDNPFLKFLEPFEGDELRSVCREMLLYSGLDKYAFLRTQIPIVGEETILNGLVEDWKRDLRRG